MGALYGSCPRCGSGFRPVRFEEKEEVFDPVTHGLVETGRTRWAIDYLICPWCGEKQCVDGDCGVLWSGERTAYATINHL